jgi:hypothetical protein
MLASLALVGTTPAQAATRVCGEVTAAAGEDRRSEQVAKQKAMTAWIAAASKFGPAFTLWRNATGKSLSCLKLADGTHRCQAFGRPCGISQVPGQPPIGSTPPQPTPAKAKGIDA